MNANQTTRTRTPKVWALKTGSRTPAFLSCCQIHLVVLPVSGRELNLLLSSLPRTSVALPSPHRHRLAFLPVSTIHRRSLTGFDVVPGIIEKMNDAGIKCFHPDDCPSDLNADIVLLSVPTPLIKETQRLDMKVRVCVRVCCRHMKNHPGLSTKYLHTSALFQ